MRPLDGEAFSHHCRNGTHFEAARCDLSQGVTAYKPARLTPEQFGADCIQMALYHGVNIFPRLTRFAGADQVRLTIIEIKD